MHKVLFENETVRVSMLDDSHPYLTVKQNEVVVLPYDSRGNIYLIEKVKKGEITHLELPRVLIDEDDKNDRILYNKVIEITGMSASNISYLGTIQVNANVMNSKVHVYQASVEHKKVKVLEHINNVSKEVCMVHKCGLVGVSNHLESGKIVCGYTQSAILKKLFKDKIHIKADNNTDKKMEETSMFGKVDKEVNPRVLTPKQAKQSLIECCSNEHDTAIEPIKPRVLSKDQAKQSLMLASANMPDRTGTEHDAAVSMFDNYHGVKRR